MSLSINTTIHDPVLNTAVVDRIDDNPVYGVLHFNVRTNYHCLTLFINDPREVDRLISHLTSMKYMLENDEEGVC
jgi:hypothetical protein